MYKQFMVNNGFHFGFLDKYQIQVKRLIPENEDKELKKWKEYINSGSYAIIQEWDTFKKSISGYDPKWRILQDVNTNLNPPEKWIPLHGNQYPLYHEFSETESYYFWCAEWLQKQKTLYELKLNEHNKAEQKRIEQENIRIEKINNEMKMFADSRKQRCMKKMNGFTISEEELEAILAKYLNDSHFCKITYPKNVFKQNTLLALKVLNRFSQENNIRVEDADVVFREYSS